MGRNEQPGDKSVFSGRGGSKRDLRHCGQAVLHGAVSAWAPRGCFVLCHRVPLGAGSGSGAHSQWRREGESWWLWLLWEVAMGCCSPRLQVERLLVSLCSLHLMCHYQTQCTGQVMCEAVPACEVPRRGETNTKDFGDEWDCLEYPLDGRKE